MAEDTVETYEMVNLEDVESGELVGSAMICMDALLQRGEADPKLNEQLKGLIAMWFGWACGEQPYQGVPDELLAAAGLTRPEL